MDIYKEAILCNLRFNTNQGSLTVEQVATLKKTQLGILTRSLKKALSKDDDDGLSFLDENKSVNKEDQLRFDIAKDLYLTKKTQEEEVKTKADRKEFEQKILGLIAQKKDKDLEGKSIEELTAMLTT